MCVRNHQSNWCIFYSKMLQCSLNWERRIVNLFRGWNIKPRWFPKMIFLVHLYVCYKVCYMLKIFSFVGQGKFQPTLRDTYIRWFSLSALTGTLVVISLVFTIWHYLCQKASQFNFFFNFSNFIGMKMHGREIKVNTSGFGTRTPGASKW